MNTFSNLSYLKLHDEKMSNMQIIVGKGDEALKKILMSLTIVFLAFSGWYIYSLYGHLNNTMDEIYTPIQRDMDIAEAEMEEKAKISSTKMERNEETQEIPSKPISLLILGVDGNGGKGNRSDAMIVMTLNPSEKKTTRISIPRDTRVMIIGENKFDKINHAYAFGGAQMAIDTVEHYLDIPIDYFVSIDMQGFEEIVNLLGGVTVYNEFAFTEKGVYFPKGELTLNGKRALAFARMRKSDPRGDVGRNERQQIIIQAVMEKGAKLSSLPRVKEFLKVVRGNIQTNLTLTDIKTLQQYFQLQKKSEVIALSGRGEKIDHIWYYIISEEERQKVITKLHTQLKMD